MQGKLTLITPPDFYENDNTSILLMHITDEEQSLISKWLHETDLTDNINLYLYSSNNTNINWVLYALSRCKYKYINADYVNNVTGSLGGYILSKNEVYFKSDNPELAEVYSYINNKRVDTIEQFLESIFGGQINNTNQSLL